MSLLESLDCGSNAPEHWFEETSVDHFGAHERSQGQLEPEYEENFEGPVEGDYFQDPAHVHIDHCKCSIAHPVRKPGLVVLHVCVCLERLYTLESRVKDAHYKGDLLRQTTCHSLVQKVINQDKALQRGWQTGHILDLGHEGQA